MTAIHPTADYLDQLADELWRFARVSGTRGQYDALHQRLVGLSREDWLDGRHTSALWRCAELVRQAVEADDPWSGSPPVEWVTVLAYLRGVAREIRARRARGRVRLVETAVLTCDGDAA